MAGVVWLAEAIPHVGEKGWCARPDAELPLDRVWGGAGRVDRAVVDAVEVMCRADDRAAVAGLSPPRERKRMWGSCRFRRDQGARKLAGAAPTVERVQATPHVLGWLFFDGRLGDADLPGIVAEHESYKRPLRRYFEEMYREATRWLIGIIGEWRLRSTE